MGNQFDNREASSFKEGIDVNGFVVHPSQVETVRYMFERHPNLESEFPENPILRSGYMTAVLMLIETMSQPANYISKKELADANDAIAFFTAEGLNLKWLEEKVEEVSELKKIAEIEKELKKLKLKCSNLEE